MTAAPTSWIDELERQITRRADTTYATPGELARALDPETVQTPAMDLIDATLVEAADTPDSRTIIVMPPQEGKSQRATRRFTEWALKHQPDTRVAICSYELSVARRWGRTIRDDITEHPETFGFQIRRDVAAQAEWQILGKAGGVVSVGIGGPLTSRAVDLLIIDDPIKDAKQADSETYRDAVWDWWTKTASTRLSPGAPVILILTRWHEDDLAGRLLAAEDGHRWKLIHIPAEADHDPNAGETDPLGREPGEFLESTRGRTTEQWEQIRVQAGPRGWQALYQGRPSSAAGEIFKRDNWRYYEQPLWFVQPSGARHVVGGYDELLISWDMAFKDLESSDYVVGGVWMRRGAEVFLLDQVRGRWDFPETCRQVIALAAKWPQALLKLVEDKANGTAVVAALRRTVPGIVAEDPGPNGKTARAAAVSPIQEARQAYLPSPMLEYDEETGDAPYAWVGDYVEELAAFPRGAHDDQVDHTSQAWHRLVLEPLIDETWHPEDDDPELAGFGGYVPA